MMPAEKGRERRVKADCCAKARTPMMMPAVAHRADRIMKARVAFQYAAGGPHGHTQASSTASAQGRKGHHEPGDHLLLLSISSTSLQMPSASPTNSSSPCKAQLPRHLLPLPCFKQAAVQSPAVGMAMEAGHAKLEFFFFF